MWHAIRLLHPSFGLVHGRCAIHVDFNVFCIFDSVGEDAVYITPMQKITLADCALANDLIVDDYIYAFASTEGVEVASAKMCECNLVPVIYVEE